VNAGSGTAATPIPEPATLLLVSIGCIGLRWHRRSRSGISAF
jgi:hypothetical protein